MAFRALERIPARVVGDGTNTISQLMDIAAEERLLDERLRHFKFVDKDDPQALKLMKKQGHTLDSIPAKDETVWLRSNSNASTGGTIAEATDRIHPDNLRLAEHAAAALYLDIAGIDLITPDITKSWTEIDSGVCEVNPKHSMKLVEDGSLSITISQLGSPVSGEFADWTAAIAFEDPAEPGLAGSVDVTIAIGSLSLGTVTDQAMGADFFDSAQFPTAQFKADLFKTDAGYEARGPLTIRDKSIDVVLPFTLELADDAATMSGNLELNRMDFDVGTSQPTEDSLGFTVIVAVELTAERDNK